jgi:hypothetical protein
MRDFYGIGPFCKALSITILSYMVAFKNCKVPIIFFILYGLGSAFFLTHILTIKQNTQQTSGIIVDAGIMEQYYNIIICSLMSIFIVVK